MITCKLSNTQQQALLDIVEGTLKSVDANDHESNTLWIGILRVLGDNEAAQAWEDSIKGEL